MLITIRDPQILQALEPAPVRCYLQSQGWQEQKPLKDGASLWELEDSSGDVFEIFLLENAGFSDYARRMYELLETLERVEGRSQLSILQDLVSYLPDASLQGLVINLNENAMFGRVTLLGVVLDQLQRIQLELPEPIYELALQAYRARMPVRVEGNLRRVSYGFEMESLREFTLDLAAWNGGLKRLEASGNGGAVAISA